MRLRLPILFLLATVISFNSSAQKYLQMIEEGTHTIKEIQKEAEAYFEVVGHERGSGYKPYKRWEYVALREQQPNGIKMANNELARSARQYRQAARQAQAQQDQLGFPGDWKELGPTYWNATSSWNPGVGHITSIGIDAANSKHIIVGSPTGGVWKTLNGGDTWTPLTDEFSTVDVYTLEISPYDSKTYLWGSTSGKIFKSTDSGSSWVATGNLTGNGKVLRINYHPTNPNVVYAVSESQGLFRSTNAGQTWTAVSGVSGIPGYDVEFKPGDPNTIYFSGVNVFRSTNGGASFTQINGFGTESNNYKMIGVSPANPSYVYIVEASGGKFGAFYRSTNSGGAFTKLQDGADINYFGYSSTGDDDRGQAPRNMEVAVNPFDAQDVHIAGIHTWRSVDGGANFFLTSYWVPGEASSLGVGYNHADIDILKFVGDTLFVGSDGGMYINPDGGQNFIDRTSGLGIREFYKIGVSKTNPNIVSGGAQDNGTSVMRGPNRAWVDWLGADGMESFIDWSNENQLYGTSQYGSMYGSDDQGNNAYDIGKPTDVGNGAWVTPFEQDPLDPNTLYVAFADIWKSTDQGGSWTKISSFDNGNFDELKIAPTDNQRLYAARGSNLFTTANGGNTWSTLTGAWGSSGINYIAIHPQDPKRVLIVTSGSVYHSTNAGVNWTNIGTGLPSGSKYCATWENTGKNGIYVGSFGAVSYTNDDLGGTWQGFFEGLPNVRVYELEINEVSHSIFAGTYGRGLWESPLYDAPPPVSAFAANKQVGCRELSVTFSDRSTSSPTAWEWTFEGGDPATSNLENPVVSYSAPGTYAVTLKTSNHAGADTLVETGFIRVSDPQAPVVTGTEICGAGEASLQAAGQPGETINWYSSVNDVTPLSTGNQFTTTITQTSTFFAAANSGQPLNQHVGPISNSIGAGDNHAGNFYQIFDAQQAFRLSSVKVYASGAAFRTFQLRNSSGAVIQAKTIFVEDGESRVALDMDIPQGSDLQLGCPSPANLFRNKAGVTYPYDLNGVVQIKNSTAGPEYYYYVYDWEIQNPDFCESERVPVTALVIPPAEAPTVSASATVLCPGETATLSAGNLCPDCVVLWSNGATGNSITVDSAGTYSATVSHSLSNSCPASAASNSISITTKNLPDAPLLTSSGATELCPGESITLTADNLCPDCDVLWSTTDISTAISVNSAGAYSAQFSNVCGAGPASEVINVSTRALPEAVTIDAGGATTVCAGESVALSLNNPCPDCSILWSTGETEADITVTESGAYSANLVNVCGNGPVSNEIAVLVKTIPQTPTLSAGGPTSLCTGETVLLSIGSDCPDCSILWSTGETTPDITVSTAGAFTAYINNSCFDSPLSNTINVTVGTPPEAPILLAGGTTVLCEGASVELTASNVCGTCSILWSTGETTPAITVSDAGSYSATVQNTCGTSPDASPIEVTHATLPEAPVISAGGATALCPGETLLLSIDLNCLNCSVIWSTGETEENITVNSEGVYTALIRNSCGDSPVSNAIAVTTLPLPVPPVISAQDLTLCTNQSTELSAGDLCGNCLLEWSGGQNTPTITVDIAGTYWAISKNSCGESVPSNLIEIVQLPPFVPEILVSNTCQLSAPVGSGYSWLFNGTPIPGATGQFWEAQVTGQYSLNMVNPDGCFGTAAPILVAACATSTFDPESGIALQVFPNPASDHLYFELKSTRSSSARIDLYAADGRLVSQLFQGEIPGGGQLLDLKLPQLPTGVYWYRLVAGGGSLEGGILVDQR